MCQGEKGVSVASNIIPDVMVKLVRACLNGTYDEALAMQKKWYPLFSGLMSLDTNPVPIKEAVAMQGHCGRELRLPMVNLDDDQLARLRSLLERFELLGS